MRAMLGNRRALAALAVTVATAVALVWIFWPQPEKKSPVVAAPAPQATVPPTKLKPAECGQPAKKGFVPTRISIADVTKNAEVLALGRDSRNVPRAAELTTEGKTQFGWDDPAQATPGVEDPIKPTGARPGDPTGNVLLNAHTWPDGQPPALGNFLLAELKVGDTIVVNGKNDAELCYKVTKKIVIKAADGSHEYYQDDGPPQLALIVCSAPRIGPGQWVNRTIWFASPITA